MKITKNSHFEPEPKLAAVISGENHLWVRHINGRGCSVLNKITRTSSSWPDTKIEDIRGLEVYEGESITITF